MQGQKGKCKDEKENARTTQKAIPWIAASKSSDQKSGGSVVLWFAIYATLVGVDLTDLPKIRGPWPPGLLPSVTPESWIGITCQYFANSIA